jgi:hypothetical protein
LAKSEDELKDVERQWDEFQSTFTAPEALDDEQLKNAVVEDLSIVSKMTVEEYTLYQKWHEIHNKYPTHQGLFGTCLQDGEQELAINEIKNNIWVPNDPMDYVKLNPVMVYANGGELSTKWNTIRTFVSTMKNNNNIGRNLNYLVMDEVTGKYLGVICISSDFLDLTPRDKYIGWPRDVKTDQGLINHTAIGSTIVPLQPLGYNYTGGKLLALLCLCDEVQNKWKELYGDTLVGVTTTSLYGKSKTNQLSQYDRLQHWKKMGFTSGSVSYETTRSTTTEIVNWLKKNHTRKYFEWFVAKKLSGQPFKRDHKNRSNTFVYSKLNIPKNMIKSDHARGIYFSPLYNNTNEFLRKEITEDKLAKAFDTSYNSLVNVWKDKYAGKRIKSLVEQDRVSKETLFYDDLIYMDWEETKTKYLPQVGR